MTNISPSAQDSDLSDFFSTAGDISKLVVKDGLNNTKRATIDFKEKEEDKIFFFLVLVDFPESKISPDA